jgi:hypothetical protein
MSSEIEPDQAKIGALYWAAVKSFYKLFDHFSQTEDKPASNTLNDDFGRLKVWAENVAAHRRGKMSLDHRLREASSVRQSVKELLSDLDSVLVDGKLSVANDMFSDGRSSKTDDYPALNIATGKSDPREENEVGPESKITDTNQPLSDDPDIEAAIASTTPLNEAIKEI